MDAEGLGREGVMVRQGTGASQYRYRYRSGGGDGFHFLFLFSLPSGVEAFAPSSGDLFLAPVGISMTYPSQIIVWILVHFLNSTAGDEVLLRYHGVCAR